MIHTKHKKIIGSIIAVVIVIIAGTGVYALVKHRSATASDSGDALVIKNTGSTNTQGWELTVKSDGSGSLTEGGTAAGTFKSDTFAMDTFRDDLKKIGSMDKLQPSGQLAKSVSFGTSEYATYQGKTSGDLNEAYDKASSSSKSLHDLLMKFVKTSGATNKPGHPVAPLKTETK